MLAPLSLEPISLAAKAVYRIENAKGMRISCVRGVAWITQERDPRDLILAAGQSVVLDRPGVAVAYAFKETVLTLAPAWQLPAPDSQATSEPERACA